jgi:hypothetical protein
MRCYNCPKSQFEAIQTMTDTEFNCKRKHICLSEDISRRNKHSQLNIQVGTLIKFKDDENWWTVRALDNRFIIATIPFEDTFKYTICDLEDCIRGADDSYCKYNYEQEDLQKCLQDLHKGELNISFRNWTFLDIESIK